jgi:hypothetical protein
MKNKSKNDWFLRERHYNSGSCNHTDETAKVEY